jgi:hypothetical protein
LVKYLLPYRHLLLLKVLMLIREKSWIVLLLRLRYCIREFHWMLLVGTVLLDEFNLRLLLLLLLRVV